MKTLSIKQFKKYLQPRPRNYHKGNAGHTLIIGGELGFSGAVRLASEAALRVGAGLVSVATRIEHAMFINITRPEIMCHGIQTVKELEPLLAKSDVIILGPGMGQSDWAKMIFSVALNINKPIVVDADGLNLLVKKPQQKSDWILTPHPGEAGRLLKLTSLAVQKNRVKAIKKIQNIYSGICVLKGEGTLIFDGNEEIAICNAGNPGMATAGTGDVLSGVIGGLLSQGIPLAVAAKLGVLIHAMAGDLSAQEKGERGMIASDLISHLRKLINI